MRYFAYGSNMCHEQMKRRCPSSNFLMRVYLEGYKLVYDGHSISRNGPVANVVISLKDRVWGGLFEINKDNLAALDCCEGYPRIYKRRELTVKDDQSTPYKTYVYLRDALNEGKPSSSYRGIVIQGAHDCGLPEEYIRTL